MRKLRQDYAGLAKLVQMQQRTIEDLRKTIDGIQRDRANFIKTPNISFPLPDAPPETSCSQPVVEAPIWSTQGISAGSPSGCVLLPPSEWVAHPISDSAALALESSEACDGGLPLPGDSGYSSSLGSPEIRLTRRRRKRRAAPAEGEPNAVPCMGTGGSETQGGSPVGKERNGHHQAGAETLTDLTTGSSDTNPTTLDLSLPPNPSGPRADDSPAQPLQPSTFGTAIAALSPEVPVPTQIIGYDRRLRSYRVQYQSGESSVPDSEVRSSDFIRLVTEFWTQEIELRRQGRMRDPLRSVPERWRTLLAAGPGGDPSEVHPPPLGSQ